MKKVLAFAGSNSSSSINKQLVQFASSKMTGNVITYVDLNEYPLPLYSIDTEKEEGIPAHAQALRELILQHDGFVIAVPEHNRSVPAFFKNTIDWISRIHMSFFEHKPILLLSTSPGPGGGKGALAHAQTILSGYLGGKVFGVFSLGRYYQNVEVQADRLVSLKGDKESELVSILTAFENELNREPEVV